MFDAGKFAPDKNSLGPPSKDTDVEGGSQDSGTQTEMESRGAQVWKFIENMIKMTEVSIRNVLLRRFHVWEVL